jgi:NADPH-dependent glutamate synthase beta subunit-like oxidoreductase/2,4-dienoyl-CoA reductase-like NADH-dependent reductase (Old Yellow Enzyme family)
MPKHERFHLRDVESLRAELAKLGLSLPLDEDFSVLGEPVALGALRTPNRFIVQPMEGFDSQPDGGPGELSFRRYRRFAEGGSGLLWCEATAILHEARSNPHQLCLNRDTVDGFARLVEATRDAARRAFGHEIVLLLQLTHSGRYSRPEGIPRPMIAHHSAVLDPLHKLPPDYPLVTDEYLDRLQDSYVAAARLAKQAGFDGVDVKSCHRYLMSELLASFTREGRYGGSLENRSRLLRETVARIQREVPGLLVTTRMNVYDAIPYPYGFGVQRETHEEPDLAEPIAVIGQLRELGLPLLNVSIGNPYYNPQYNRPFDRPIVGAPVPDEHPLAGVVRFLNITRTIQHTFPDLPIVGSGYSWLRHLTPYVAAGVVRTGGATLIGQGRGAFAYPDSVRDVLRLGRMEPGRTCITCSACTQIMRDGAMTGCVVRDAEVYGPWYKLARRFAQDRLRDEAHRCRQCEFATCTAGCPAGVDVPRFIRAFAEGEVGRAYDVLREANVLPEMCAYVCPCEVQCEGGCVERIFADRPIPVRDLQLAVCRAARRQGLVGLRLPQAATGRRVAIVGGGPAGLAAAIVLLERGHEVTLFEKSERLGGTPDGIIPAARYGSAGEEIDAIFAPAKTAGRLHLELGRALGTDLSLADLRDRFDAVLLALGLPRSTSLGQAQGAVDALTFLSDVKCERLTSVPKRVAVLGGGNTAMDAAVTALELGAQDVFVVYRRSFAEMPAWPEEREQFLGRGGQLLILSQPLGYLTDDKGQLIGVRIARTELGDPDASGRRRPVVVPESEWILTVGMVVEAIGQELPHTLRESLDGVRLTRNGLVAMCEGSMATSVPGVFAAGDLTSGGTTAVQGVAEGMRAAREIDAALGGARTAGKSAAS